MKSRCIQCGTFCSAKRKYCSEKCGNIYYYEHNREQIRNNNLKYYYKNRKKVLAYQIARIERLRRENPEFHKKYNARHKAEQEFSLKGKICERCGKYKAKFRHHEDYDKPLEVILCCKKCHKILDEEISNHTERKINNK